MIKYNIRLLWRGINPEFNSIKRALWRLFTKQRKLDYAQFEQAKLTVNRWRGHVNRYWNCLFVDITSIDYATHFLFKGAIILKWSCWKILIINVFLCISGTQIWLAISIFPLNLALTQKNTTEQANQCFQEQNLQIVWLIKLQLRFIQRDLQIR